MFTSEKTVSFNVGQTAYTLFVDQQDVVDGELRVNIVRYDNGDAIIDLPRETLISGNRIRVPKDLLVLEPRQASAA